MPTAFLIRPAPILGESLSSWRHRSSLENGYSWLRSPSERHPSRDLDMCSDETMRWLSSSFAVDQSRLERMRLPSDSSPAVGTSGNRLRWVCARRADVSDAVGVYCPCCLAHDEKPHFRLDWRRAWMTRCEQHDVLMRDRCPACGHSCWPAMQGSPTIARLGNTGLRACSHCGHDLASDDSQPRSGTDLGLILHGRTQVSTTDGTESLLEHRIGYLDAAWILSQLLLRYFIHRRSVGSQRRALYPQDDIAAAMTCKSVEELPLQLRDAVVHDAFDLLRDWPQGLLSFCAENGLSWQHFSPNRAAQPSWFAAVIAEHLPQQRASLSRESVDAAVNLLRINRLPVTKMAVKRLLRVSESKEIDRAVPHRRQATLDELDAICDRFESAIADAPESRDERATLVRDYAILLTSVRIQAPIERAVALTVEECVAIVDGGPDDLFEISVAARTTRWLGRYLGAIRPVFVTRTGTSNPRCFVGRSTRELLAHGPRQRVARMMKDFDPLLWRSADVFSRVCDAE